MIKYQWPPILLSLGKYSYNLENGYLESSTGLRINLRPQSAQVLKQLADQANEIVTKDEVISNVWRGISVTDDSIVQCIADIRRAIDDKDRSILRTIPKRGYRLVPTSTDSLPATARTVDASENNTIEITKPLNLGDSKGATVFIQVDGRGDRSKIGENDHFSPWPQLAHFVENRLISNFNGRVAESFGEGIFLEFEHASKALDCMLELHSWCNEHNKGALRDEQITLRTGVDLGAVHRGGGHVATLLSGLARPNDIIVSTNVRDSLSGKLDCEFVDIGDREITESAAPVRCFRALPLTADAFFAPILNSDDLLPTIAVIPFTSRSQRQEIEVVGEVLADDVISRLSRSAEVNVISRLSTTEFRQRKASLAEIGTALRADFVLSGRYSEKKGQLEIEAELAEVSTGRILWLDRTIGKIGQGLDATESVDWIVTRVQRAIFRHEVSRARSNPLPTLKSYTLLMSAVALMHRLSPSSFYAARTLLDALVERVADQPVPLAWMARWHVLRVQQGWSVTPIEDAEAALRCTQKALDIDPENVLALVSEGFVLTNLLHRLDDAEDRYDKALDVSPNDAMGRLLRGTLFAFRGEGARAVRDTERALHLTPLDPIRFFFLSLSASACLAKEDYERSLRLSKLSLRANGSHTSTLRVQAVAQMRLNQVNDARLTGQRLMALQPNMRVGSWLENSPSRDYPVGRAFAQTLREIGIPN